MPIMSVSESAFCRSAPWNWFNARVVVPWANRLAQPSGSVLEIGGGSGAMCRSLAERTPEAHFTLTDIDPAMVRAATKRLRGLDNVVARSADVTDLPFAAGQFDVVSSYLMLHHVIDWRDALGEARRVLRPGGSLVGYDLTKTKAAVAVHRLDRSPFDLMSPGDLATALDSAGFVDIQVQTSLAGHLMRFRADAPGTDTSS